MEQSRKLEGRAKFQFYIKNHTNEVFKVVVWNGLLLWVMYMVVASVGLLPLIVYEVGFGTEDMDGGWEKTLVGFAPIAFTFTIIGVSLWLAAKVWRNFKWVPFKYNELEQGVIDRRREKARERLDRVLGWFRRGGSGRF